MLLNIAEDLKEYAKIKVAPGVQDFVQATATTEKKGSKSSNNKDTKQKSEKELKDMAEKQAFVKLDSSTIEDEVFDEDSDRASYLYMELESTASFKDIDIDKMLQHTTLDDFMRGLYTTAKTGESYHEEKAKNVMGALLTGKGLDNLNAEKDTGLKFGQEEEIEIQGDLLRQKALMNLRDRRLRLK